MRKITIFTFVLCTIIGYSCKREIAPISVAGYIAATSNEQIITIEVVDSAGVKLQQSHELSFLIDDDTHFQSNSIVAGNIAEIIYLPEESDKLPTAIEIATDDTYPRALGRWTNGEQNRLKIDIELLPNGHIRQYQPQQTVVFSSWQLTNKEDSITLSGTVSLPAAVEEKPKSKNSQQTKKRDEDTVIVPPSRRTISFNIGATLGIDGDRKSLTILSGNVGRGERPILYRAE